MQTKSKTIAIFLAIFGLNDIYLGNFGRFIKKCIVGLVTLGIGIVIWQIMDIIGLVTGRINCDNKGNPIE